MNLHQPSATSDPAARANRRAWWLRQLRQWHWISGALSLCGILLFAITGITLNHAASIQSKATVVAREAAVPAAVKGAIAAKPPSDKAPLPAEVASWIKSEFSVDATSLATEWSDDGVYISEPRAGGDGWINIDREAGTARYERTDRGWIAYLNDLHKGRNTGSAWSLFIDAFAAACIVFSVTGLLLLQMYSIGRPATWPVVGLGLVLPILLAVLFIHQ